uniref:G protein-coupled receptor 34b n=1 Tax=Salarias fasciatus TaxID=181472 RepID=A0A672IF73_SALFA
SRAHHEATWIRETFLSSFQIGSSRLCLVLAFFSQPDINRFPVLFTGPETPIMNSSCVNYDALQKPLAVLYSVIFVPGLAGNLVALWVFVRLHSKKNSVRVFLINLAVADLLLLVCLPFRILYHSRGNVWTLDPTLCRVVGLVFYMNIVALCAAVWIVAFTLTFALMCFHYKEFHGEQWKAYINIFAVVIFWLVYISLIVSYGKIALKLLRTSQAKPDLPNAPHYTRTAKKSFFILFLFTVCFVPYHLVRAFYIKTQITETPCFWIGVADRANELALLLSTMNSCLDPVMYFLLSSSVRKEVQRLLSGVRFVRDVPGISGSSSMADVDGRSGRTDRGQPTDAQTDTGEKLCVSPV